MKVLIPVFVLLSVAFYSCSKEKSFEIPTPDPGPGEITLEGKWNFVEARTASETGILISENNIRMESTYWYTDTSSDNKGNLTIEATTMSGQHSYKVDTYIYNKSFANGVQVEGPPPTKLEFKFETNDFTTRYQKEGTDSLYFPDGPIFNLPDPVTGQAIAPPGGLTYEIKSDTLFLYMNQLDQIKQENSEINAASSLTAVYKRAQ